MDPEIILAIEAHRLGRNALARDELPPARVTRALLAATLRLACSAFECKEVVNWLRRNADVLAAEDFGAQVRAIMRKEQHNDVPN